MVCSTEIDSFPFHALRFRSCLLSFLLRRFKFSRSQLLVLKSNSSCFSPNSASNSICPGFGTKCVDCQLVTCNAMPKWKAKYFFFIKHCWKSVYFQTFLFFIYVYFSVFFFAGFFGPQALTLVVLEGATGCSNLLFANWNSCRHARANPLGMHSIAQNFSISALLSSSAS